MIANTMNQVYEKFYAILLQIVKFITKKRNKCTFQFGSNFATYLLTCPLLYKVSRPPGSKTKI